MVDNKSQTFITDTFKYRYETDTTLFHHKYGMVVEKCYLKYSVPCQKRHIFKSQ